MSRFDQILPDLFLFADTCNVYVVRRGERALLVDCGSGAVVDHLDELGVVAVDWVLFTHHHRDQCFGAPRLIDAGARLAVPGHERALFERADAYWQQKRIWDNYNDRSTFHTIGVDLQVAASLVDYETFAWQDLRLEVLPAPGHTHGQVALVGDVSGRRVAFTGDLMRAGGKLHELHSMEYEYGDLAGVHFSAAALDQLRKRAPEIALPSHGDLVDDAPACVDALESRLRSLMAMPPYRSSAARDRQVFSHEVPLAAVSEHLLWSDDATCSNFFVIRSDSGKGLLVDYPYFSNSLFGIALQTAEPSFALRFVEHHIDELRDRWGVEQIDVVVPTHIHDDHVCGIPYLQRHHGTQVWALDQVAKVLEAPERYNTPCLIADPIPVDRVLADGDRFEWEGFRFEIVHYPGQTEFHSAILCENLDDRRVLFVGDSSYPLARYCPGEEGWMVNWVLRNSFTFAMHRKVADEFDRLRADRLCPGHGPVYDIPEEAFALHRQYVEDKEALWRDAVAAPAELGVDLFWARLLPYQIRLVPEGSATVELELRNSFERDATFVARLQSPASLSMTPASQEVSLAAGEPATLRFEIASGDVAPEPHRRHLLFAHVAVDGVARGPVIEALVTVE